MTTNGTGGAGGDVSLLLERFVALTPGARHALLLSADGLKLHWSPELSVDRADQLAAIASGIQSLVHGASVEFGDGTGGVRQSMTDFHGGALFIVEAGAGAHLAVVGEESADARAIGRGMNDIVEAARGPQGTLPAAGVRGKLPA
ncbi:MULTISPECIES: roadblock/LC7 domain-containing protein [Streptomycetaceae]|uniref:roadblock/LC7 domain-containing protein n=1 Tax=Streptomycetaceae TaxID=2062 RepID=UPI00300AE0CC